MRKRCKHIRTAGRCVNICNIKISPIKNDIQNEPKKIHSYIKNITICPGLICVIIIGIALVLVSMPPVSFWVCKKLNIQPITEKTITNSTFYDTNAVQTSRSHTESTKTIPYDNPYFFLFLIALLGFEGTCIFFICMAYREKIKHALLTYAYDKALTQVGTQSDKKIIETSHKKEGVQDDNNITKSKKEKIDYGIWAITKIFEAYCQNITAK